MHLRLFSLITATVCVVPHMLNAQSPEPTNGWVIAASLGAGVANVPNSPTPVYFDATQLTARLAVQRTLGAGFSGGVSLLATLDTQGSDCALGPCAPQFSHNAGSATLTYVPGRTVQRWIPIASLSAGVARLPEQWAATPGTRTPAASTWLVGGALDLPLMVRPRTTLLVGWEGSVLPNAPGDHVVVNTIVVTVRHALLRRSARLCNRVDR